MRRATPWLALAVVAILIVGCKGAPEYVPAPPDKGDDCPLCTDGRAACSTCRGLGTAPCPKCGGRGTVRAVLPAGTTCPRCHGRGSGTSSWSGTTAACRTCGGTGALLKELPTRGVEPCPGCQESKVATCPACKGSLSTGTCLACQGSARVYLGARRLEQLGAILRPCAGGFVILWTAPGGPAEKLGLLPDDRLIAIDDKPLDGPADAARRLEDLLQQRARRVTIRFERAGVEDSTSIPAGALHGGIPVLADEPRGETRPR